MGATGIIRRIDDLGRVVIPRELRRKLGIKEGDPLELFIDSDSVTFKKYHPEADHKGRVRELKRAIQDDEHIAAVIRQEIMRKAEELDALLDDLLGEGRPSDEG